MGVVVQKFGGSSMADVESIRRVAARIAATHESGKSIVAVVSAMGHTTDELLDLARSISDNPARRELDMLLSAGERISMALLSLALNARGVPAVSFTGSQSGIITNDAHTNAHIIEVRPVRVQDELARGRVVIVAGYQGVSYKREVTTLGRGGSDTTSVALAAALGAEACELYSDVDGVYSADPRVVPDAVRLSQLSYEEMQALAEAGARVLNAQAVEFAQDKGIALFARATSGSSAETVIRRDASPAERVVSVASQTHLALLSIGPGPAGLARLASVVGDAGVAAREVQMRETGHAALLLSLGDVPDFEALPGDAARRAGGCHGDHATARRRFRDRPRRQRLAGDARDHPRDRRWCGRECRRRVGVELPHQPARRGPGRGRDRPPASRAARRATPPGLVSGPPVAILHVQEMK